jgi:glycolate oxidase FAD binding subunit
VLTADGVPTKAGGMVVKNVTGFDMMRLHYGALGAFGAITRLNFKVVPRPEATLHCTAEFATAAKAYEAGVAMLGSGVELAALYVIASAADAWTLHAVVEGGAAAAERQARHVCDLAGDGAVEPLSASAAPGFATFLDLAADRLVARLSTPASRQVELLGRMQFSGSEQLCADLGSGLVYITTVPKIEWRVALRRLDARAVFLALPPEQKLNIDVLAGEPGPALEILKRLKHEFDPAGRFNYGRFVAGL